MIALPVGVGLFAVVLLAAINILYAALYIFAAFNSIPKMREVFGSLIKYEILISVLILAGFLLYPG